jgi:hypothetical protein
MSDSGHSSEEEIVNDLHESTGLPDTSPTAKDVKETKIIKSSNEDSEEDENDSDEDDQQEDSDEKVPKESLYESDTCDSEQEPTDEGEDFKPREIKREFWLKKGWPFNIPIPKMTNVEEVLTEWKKSNGNALPGPADFCRKLGLFANEVDEPDAVDRALQQINMFELIVGKRKDGKLNQQGQKGSLRSLWKEQFPKSKRDKGGLSFSAIENEEMLPVEKAYFPLLQKAIENMTKRAERCDKGHMPKAKLAAWQQRLEKTRQSLKKRTEADERIKEARAAAINKARSKKSSENFEEKVNKKAEELVEERVKERAIDMKERVKELVNDGMNFADAIDKAMAI